MQFAGYVQPLAGLQKIGEGRLIYQYIAPTGQIQYFTKTNEHHFDLCLAA